MAREKASCVLVVDDQLALAEALAEGLRERGYDARPVNSGRAAAQLLSEEHVDAVLTDLRMPDMDGLELLALSRRSNPERPVIMMTAFSAVDTAVESIRQGAYHYLTKPFKVEELALFLARALSEARLRRETRALKRALGERAASAELLGGSTAMRAVRDLCVRVADADVPVLILGETGTGKGLCARAIHDLGPRASGPFVAVNCAALPEQLLESELFGHVRGAFTGAVRSRDGLFVEADGGTLLLDEVGEMVPALQAKLLHVLERGSVRAVGASRERAVDVRVLAATHRDLRARVAAGTFREDLLYRMEVVSVTLAPLRERREDLPLLIEHFLRQALAAHPRSPVVRLAPETEALLLDYAWPGNVRELQHVIERVVLLGRSPEVQLDDLPPALTTERRAASAGRALAPEGRALPLSLRGAEQEEAILPIREVQRRYAAWALARLSGRKMLTCERLGIDSKTLARWLEEEEHS